jgi:hypothetical protein
MQKLTANFARMFPSKAEPAPHLRDLIIQDVERIARRILGRITGRVALHSGTSLR